MIKFIAADLDGTLLNSSHALPDGFMELVEKLYDMGITFAAASGRQNDRRRCTRGAGCGKTEILPEAGKCLKAGKGAGGRAGH